MQGQQYASAGETLVPLLADRAYEFQVAVNLNGANGGYLSVARSVVDFTPLIGLSPVPGRIYLPNVANPNPGSVAYTFDINVEGASLDIQHRPSGRGRFHLQDRRWRSEFRERGSADERQLVLVERLLIHLQAGSFLRGQRLRFRRWRG